MSTGSINAHCSSDRSLWYGLRSLTPPTPPAHRLRTGTFRLRSHHQTTPEPLKESRTVRSEKGQAAPTYKGGFGFHPLVCFLANTGECMSGRLRPGNAGANTAADHIAVLDDALAQIPDTHRHGTDIPVRTDSAGSAKAFLTHVRDMRIRGIRTFFSVGYAVTEPVRRAIRALPEQAWHPALDQDGTMRAGASVAERALTRNLGHGLCGLGQGS
ncbi:transposase [Streptomyces bacillaris]|uniref:transposase n=1 Tax=Streptomyces bacillaris TaxID=68179 RepID=UPI0036B1D661